MSLKETSLKLQSLLSFKERISPRIYLSYHLSSCHLATCVCIIISCSCVNIYTHKILLRVYQSLLKVYKSVPFMIYINMYNTLLLHSMCVNVHTHKTLLEVYENLPFMMYINMHSILLLYSIRLNCVCYSEACYTYICGYHISE